MRNIILILLMLLPLTAQDNDQISERLKSLFEASKNKDYKSAAVMIAYTGSDAERKFKSSLKAESESELEQAERIAKKIKAYLDISDSYTINGIQSTGADAQSFTVVSVIFKSGKQELEIPFKFVKSNDNFLLVSID